jgi:hypothetical protein
LLPIGVLRGGFREDDALDPKEQVMTTDRIAALEALLTETEEAHGAYEAAELKGVYDEDWAHWYAGYAVEHGIGELLGRAVTVDELARFLARSWRDSQEDERARAEPWPAHTARRVAEGM